ncbi:hypothetical protein OPV22_007662 [Ensete ventricosum]|uniref:Uncharacterized protein n=1 Tax=Ensete ventricosum TaxID=4639 RepID=A0AAV8RTW1_ENSVE|nr:hypothetical protein OPV22_007662 [Ensete ventricosum]
MEKPILMFVALEGERSWCCDWGHLIVSYLCRDVSRDAGSLSWRTVSVPHACRRTMSVTLYYPANIAQDNDYTDTPS